VRIDGCWVGGAFTRGEASIEGYVESAEYHLDLQLVPFDFSLVKPGVWCVRPPLEGPLNSTYNPGVVQWESRWDQKLMTHLSKSLIAIPTRSLRSSGFLPRITIPSSSHTSKQYPDSCTESSLLIILSCSDHQRKSTDGRRTRALTRTRARIVLTTLKTCFAGEASAISLFRISILASRSDALALRVGVSIVTYLV